MDAPDQVRTKGTMHQPMPRNPAFSFEISTSQPNIKVTFARFWCACMASMAGAVIHDDDLAQVERCAQFVFNFLSD